MRSSIDEGEDARGLLDNTWSKPTEKSNTKLWVVSVLCLLAGFAFGTMFGSIPTAKLSQAYSKSSPVPLAASLKYTFKPNETFANAAPGPDADRLWEKLMPLGRGFVQYTQDGKFIAHDGSPRDLAQTKVVAAFHQVHCLNNLRKSLYASTADPETFQYMIPQLQQHWGHCFEYLRQSLMCNADLTLEDLEKSKVDDERLLASVDGWGTKHKCVDWDALFEWTEKYRSTNDGGID